MTGETVMVAADAAPVVLVVMRKFRAVAPKARRVRGLTGSTFAIENDVPSRKVSPVVQVNVIWLSPLATVSFTVTAPAQVLTVYSYSDIDSYQSKPSAFPTMPVRYIFVMSVEGLKLVKLAPFRPRITTGGTKMPRSFPICGQPSSTSRCRAAPEQASKVVALVLSPTMFEVCRVAQFAHRDSISCAICATAGSMYSFERIASPRSRLTAFS